MMRTGDVGETDARRVDAASGARAPVAEGYDLAVVGHEQARIGAINGARCDQVACIDVDWNAETANVDAERAT